MARRFAPMETCPERDKFGRTRPCDDRSHTPRGLERATKTVQLRYLVCRVRFARVSCPWLRFRKTVTVPVPVYSTVPGTMVPGIPVASCSVRPTYADTHSLSTSVDVDVVSVSYQVHLALFRSSSLNDASLIAM